MPADVAASKKTVSVRDLVLGREPHGPLNTNKVAGVLASAVWARSQSSHTKRKRLRPKIREETPAAWLERGMPGPPARSRSTHRPGGLIEARRGLTDSFDDKTADQARAIVASSAARPHRSIGNLLVSFS
jgi:hypothetical protein